MICLQVVAGNHRIFVGLDVGLGQKARPSPNDVYHNCNVRGHKAHECKKKWYQCGEPSGHISCNKKSGLKDWKATRERSGTSMRFSDNPSSLFGIEHDIRKALFERYPGIG